MKRLLIFLLIALMLTGCGNNKSSMERIVSMRQKLLSSECQFDIRIIADYGENLYEFSMQCAANQAGKLSFSVLSPDTIMGISGSISDLSGELVFDDNVLVFETLTDGIVTPVTAPWIFVRALRAGYIKAVGSQTDQINVQIQDTYKGYDFEVDIILDDNDIPISAEILWSGRRVVTMYVENFKYL